MSRPVGSPGAESLASGLLVVGAAQDIEQVVKHLHVALFGTINGLLRQVVAQNETRIGPVHAGNAVFCRLPVMAQTCAVACQPAHEVGRKTLAKVFTVEGFTQDVRVRSSDVELRKLAEKAGLQVIRCAPFTRERRPPHFEVLSMIARRP